LFFHRPIEALFANVAQSFTPFSVSLTRYYDKVEVTFTLHYISLNPLFIEKQKKNKGGIRLRTDRDVEESKEADPSLLILHLFFFRPFFVMERCMEGYDLNMVYYDDDRLKRNQQTNSKFLLNYFLVNIIITLEEFLFTLCGLCSTCECFQVNLGLWLIINVRFLWSFLWR
jgi:hypothetical protein